MSQPLEESWSIVRKSYSGRSRFAPPGQSGPIASSRWSSRWPTPDDPPVLETVLFRNRAYIPMPMATVNRSEKRTRMSEFKFRSMAAPPYSREVIANP